MTTQTDPVMLNGKCYPCQVAFEGSGPDCWCAYCHGLYSAELYKRGFSEEVIASVGHYPWLCPDCGKDCARASSHWWASDESPLSKKLAGGSNDGE